MKNFRTFDLAVAFYRSVQTLRLPAYLRDQLLRAASSVALNLAEGRGKQTIADQKRFFSIALGSVRECEAVLILAGLQDRQAMRTLDSLGAHLYNLIKRAG
jgi:four helix bundle protein